MAGKTIQAKLVCKSDVDTRVMCRLKFVAMNVAENKMWLRPSQALFKS
jgi:hypothetical protein